MTKTKTVNAIFTIILIAVCSAGARIIHDVGIIADEYGLSGHWMKLDRLYIILITAILLIVLNVIFFFKKSNKIGRLVLYSINVAVIVSGIFIICNLKTDIREFIETKPLPTVEIAVDSLDELL